MKKVIVLLTFICISPALWAADSAPITVKITTADGRTIFVETAIAKYSKTLSDTMGDIDPDILQQQGIPVPYDFTSVNALLEILHTKGFAALHALEEQEPGRSQQGSNAHIFDAIVQRILADREYYATQKGYQTNFLAHSIMLANYLDIPVLLRATLTAGAQYWFSHEGLKNMADGNERAFHLPPELRDEVVKIARQQNAALEAISTTKTEKKYSFSLNEYVGSLAVGPHGWIIVTHGRENTRTVWKVSWHGNIVKKTFENVKGVTISPDGRIINTYTWDNIAHIWDSADDSLVATIDCSDIKDRWRISDIAVSIDKKIAAVNLFDINYQAIKVRIVNLADHSIVHEFPIEKDVDGYNIIWPTINSNEQIIITGFKKRIEEHRNIHAIATIDILDFSGQKLNSFALPNLLFPEIIPNADDASIIIIRSSFPTFIYNRNTKTIIDLDHYFMATNIAISNNGKKIAIEHSGGGTTKIIKPNWEEFRNSKILVTFKETWKKLAMTDNGKNILTISDIHSPNLASIWTIAPPELQRFLEADSTIAQLQLFMAIKEGIISAPTDTWFNEHPHSKTIRDSLPTGIFDDFINFEEK